MGIDNFAKLIQVVSKPSSEPTYFDSVLIDCQSFLYTAIEHCITLDEEKNVFNEISKSVWEDIRHSLNFFMSFKPKYPTFILSFDGEGVPMKWATQRERRSKNSECRKTFYRYILFGHNKLSMEVQNYVKTKIKECCYSMKVVLCGSNVPGEGEHKIFQIAEVLKDCQNPIVASIDQDVFILSLLRLSRYQSIQIFRYNQFYNINQLVTKDLPYPLKRLITVSFLFGNDFIKKLIGITATNSPDIHNSLSKIEEDNNPPLIIVSFIENFQHKIRFTPVEFVDRDLIINFWMTYFWILDYYTLRRFPQQFLLNELHSAFNRNQLLTGLSDEEFSKESFKIAKDKYECLITQPIFNAEQYVFVNSEHLVKQLKTYWIESENQFCSVMNLTTSNRKKRKLKKSQSLDNEIIQHVE